MTDEETKHYLDLYGYLPWTITIADALEVGREWDRKHIADVLRSAQEKIDFLTKAYVQAAAQRDELMQEQKKWLLDKPPTKLMVIPALMEAAGWVRKKEWVELTEEEREGLLLDHEGYGILNYARAIEAKLKEKNT